MSLTTAALAIALLLGVADCVSGSGGMQPSTSVAVSDTGGGGGGGAGATEAPSHADAATVERAREAIRQFHLTERSLECLTFEVQPGDAPAIRFVNVREKHSEECGGDPSTAPRLFSVQVNTKTGELATDARSDLGEFEPLRPVKKGKP